MGEVTAKDLIKEFKFKLLNNEEAVAFRPVTTSDISRPGMEMAGYFTYYPAKRIQLLGKTEMSFYDELDEEAKIDRMEGLCTYDTPAIILSRGMEAPENLIEAADRVGVPVLSSPMTTTRLSSQLTTFLESRLAPMTAVHGVLIDIYGIGVLITGSSGVGKSETALDLVRRGHRLVADDSVEIREEHDNVLVGRAPELIKHLLEIRGLGIINVMTLFGAGSVRNFKRIGLTIDLEIWDQKKQYDRLGLDEETIKIFDTDLPKITLPVRPGRNLAVIIEVAAMNFRLKRMGINAAEQFSERLNHVIEESDREEY
ncbi:HPr kinase/phosphorylase [Salipaludibacillus agaradhaerens]|jgi:HPr kinase/phosphorylase|uniref:HPr kinase/phosphorylase n=1 Tax=Salipaludibacillus agaradhaerens TaxID=76935 RepID=A0A9Q4FX40_SALAG|nr:HPr(Ser) kinase/phosphatase [Salipaludibacillus agaradhaerens]UJW59033.1 HPr kinase/phosphorylase [Bacillus sp. A116_S68]MCR6095131.1 HPr kinase/phosphorylase [Salipaludibacillus agaradhaerens]MCR6107956.1 HPr kinase/phosphorylase [Salipaludibacillus agaradhaerens]MCR6115311.1 HPr kinase/phosphorylase [Salipaludibacillus agaradhaerens]MCR6119982.1 HPr kinase/phosphorylase [Salipaludibacillus agaradhaerens]